MNWHFEAYLALLRNVEDAELFELNGLCYADRFLLVKLIVD
jgi:hypothetical protein